MLLPFTFPHDIWSCICKRLHNAYFSTMASSDDLTVKSGSAATPSGSHWACADIDLKRSSY